MLLPVIGTLSLFATTLALFFTTVSFGRNRR